MKIAREGLPILAGLLLTALIAGWLVRPAVGGVLLAPAVFTAWFFRDPERTTPQDADLLVAPADGRILSAGPGTVSIFMNVFDVHVCRSPSRGRVEEVRHTPGRFLAAYREPASEQNERVAILVDDGGRRIRFTLVAGLVARRIVCRVVPGQQVRAGERVGLIRFGSRVDVSLPVGAEVAVRVGQRVVAGETPIARLAGQARAATLGHAERVPI